MILSTEKKKEHLLTDTKTMYQFSLKVKKLGFPSVQITSSENIVSFLRSIYDKDEMLINEQFYIVLLNQSNHTIGFKKISEGGLSGTVVDPRLIVKFAIEFLATGVILSHNHPSGNTKPSSNDIAITKKLKECFSFFDIRLLDHVILTEHSYYSFTDEGSL